MSIKKSLHTDPDYVEPDEFVDEEGDVKDEASPSLEDAANLPPVTHRKRKGGRPEIVVDPQILRQLARIGCTQKEASQVLGFKGNQIRNRPDLLKVWREGKAEGKMTLRRALYRNAVDNNNVQAQIWLSKQDTWLGMSDRKEITGKDGGAITIAALADLADDIEIEERKREAIEADYEVLGGPEPDVLEASDDSDSEEFFGDDE